MTGSWQPGAGRGISHIDTNHANPGTTFSAWSKWKPKLTSVFITGASGYLGSAIAAQLENAGHAVTRGVRTARLSPANSPSNTVIHGDLSFNTQWADLLTGHDVVVHCAGPAHVTESDRDHARSVITDATRHLAQSAAEVGVKRFIFMSSAHVLGLSSPEGHPLTEDSEPHPHSTYACAKLDAEVAGRDVARQNAMAPNAMEWIALRPPMVYGPKCPGNFSRLVRLVQLGIPLPLATATALKTFICIDNLSSAVASAVTHPTPLNNTYVIADNESCSTRELLNMIATALDRRQPILIPLPGTVLAAAAQVAGRRHEIERLLARCELSNAKFRANLNWSPPTTLQDGIKAAARAVI